METDLSLEFLRVVERVLVALVHDELGLARGLVTREVRMVAGRVVQPDLAKVHV